MENESDVLSGPGTTATLATDGVAVGGTLETDTDSDWYRVNLSTDFGYVFVAEGDGTATTVPDISIALYDSAANLLDSSRSNSPRDTIVFNPSISGDYFFAIGDPTNRSFGEAGSFDIRVIQEVAGGPGTVAELRDDTVLNSTIETNVDTDWFRVTLEAGTRYAFELSGDGTPTSASNLALQLRDEVGVEIASRSTRDGLIRIEYNVAQTGTYFVRVGEAANTSIGAPGTYALRYFEDQGVGAENGQLSALNESVFGRIDYSDDLDTFAYDLIANTEYAMLLQSVGSEDPITNATLSVFSDRLRPDFLFESDIDNLAAVFVAPATGRYGIVVGDDAPVRDLTGDYQLVVTAIEAGTSGNDRLTGDAGTNALRGGVGNDTISGQDGSDILLGEDGDDRIEGGRGDEQIDGGSGIDTAVFSGNQENYVLEIYQGGYVVADKRADGNGTDRLFGIERLDFGTEISAFGGQPLDLQRFAGVTSLSEDDFGLLIEMYIAYFNRAPDAVGLFFWGTAFAQGLSLDEMADLFFDQPETRATYPDLTDLTAYAQQVYQNVLGRDFDQAGLDFWVGALESGQVTPSAFVLEMIRGAKAPAPVEASDAFKEQKAADVAYLENKTDIGAYFSVIGGLSNVDTARNVMDLYDGSEQSIVDAVAATNSAFEAASAASGGEFIMQLVGVIDDPFV